MSVSRPSGKPLVTVVTLTYKKFDRLFDTIKSVEDQDYPEIEYVIADDGSPDFPKDEIQQFLCDSKLKSYLILDSSENRGTVKNINNAYRRSHGDYLINLSCGDVFCAKDVVSKIVNCFLTKEADVLVTSRIMYSGNYSPVCYLPHIRDRKTIESWNTPNKQYKAFITSSFLNMASGSAMYFSRTVMEKMGYFDEKYVLWEDGPFIAKYLKESKIDTAYDIVSTWYESEGVSNSKMHPLLYKDTVRFNNTDKMERYKTFGYWDRQKIIYRNKSLECQSAKERLALKFLFFPVFCYFFVLWLKDKMGNNDDQKHIRKSGVRFSAN